MIVSKLRLKNWRNFRSIDIELHERGFFVGPNASGKSNLLDVFMFLRDLAKAGGGLQYAVRKRGGLSKIRCLAARKTPDVEIEIELKDDTVTSQPTWVYAVGVRQQKGGQNLPIVAYEHVEKNGKDVLNRPDDADRKDPLRQTETHLEQINSNQMFREAATFFQKTLYLHLVPQLLRFPEAFRGLGLPDDPYGMNFLERVARTPERTRRSRLKKIEAALQIAVPQLKDLSYNSDASGTPHLEALYEHWRPTGAKQREDQFSDGTVRIIGLLWSLLDGDSLLLLEEPELSLNVSIIRRLPALIYRLQRGRQVLLSTHSVDLLSDHGIGAEEVFLLTPGAEGTRVRAVRDNREARLLLDDGMTIGEAVMPSTEPVDIDQLSLFR